MSSSIADRVLDLGLVQAPVASSYYHCILSNLVIILLLNSVSYRLDTFGKLKATAGVTLHFILPGY